MTAPHSAAPDITAMSDDELALRLFSVNYCKGLPEVASWIGHMQPTQKYWKSLAAYVRTLIPAAPEPVVRVPVAMTDGGGILTVACNDGTVWYLMEKTKKWDQVDPIPHTPGPSQAKTDPYGGWEAGAAQPDPVAAAAPDLLLIVKLARDILSRQPGRPDFLAACDEAIAKAEGRT